MLLASLFRGLAGRLHVLGLTLLASFTTAAMAQINTPSAADGFDPNVDGNVFAVAVQPDGKVIIAGQFTKLLTPVGDPVYRNNLARVNADGSVDESFNPNPDAPVRSVVALSDGKILVGGDFASIGGAARSRLARLTASGAADPAFSPGVGSSVAGGLQIKPQVFAVLTQPDGGILVAGSFGSATSNGGASATTRNNLARFSASGVLDAAFNPNPDGMVLSLAMYGADKILIGGGFKNLQPNGATSATARVRLARLNLSGTVDDGFAPEFNNAISAIAVQRDGAIFVGGTFTTIKPAGADTAVERGYFAKINGNGTIDDSYSGTIAGPVLALVVQSDGALVVGGRFSGAWAKGVIGQTRNNIARFTSDGALDPAFNPSLNGDVDALALQADGSVVIGGYFTRAQPPGATTAVVRNHVARVLPTGALDAAFQLDAGGRILVSRVQTDNKIVVAGSFTSIGGATHTYLARLNADGSVDSSYNVDVNGRIFALALQPDNKAIIGGAFTTVAGQTRNHIARLNADGTLDSGFNPNIDGQVGAIVVQPDGKIVAAGAFTNVTPPGATASTTRFNILRLTPGGDLDTGFDPHVNNGVSALALQSDGKIILAGSFTTIQPGSGGDIWLRNYMARVNADGSLDTGFDPNPNSAVSAVALQSDGKILVGGGFVDFATNGATSYTPRNRLARLNADGSLDTAFDPNLNDHVIAVAVQSDGKILVGGAFTTVTPAGKSESIRKYFARLNADGTVDTAFDLDFSEQVGNRVDSITVQRDGKFLVGGNFIGLQTAGTGTRFARKNFARINADGSLDTAFDVGAGGSPSAVINALAVQPDNKLIVAGKFSDLGGAKSTNIARFTPEGIADATFNTALATDGTVNALAFRANTSAVATQVGGFAWLNRDGTLSNAFRPTAKVRGEIMAAAVDGSGRLLLGGLFADLSGATHGNLVRYNTDGSIDGGFAPTINGAVSSIAVLGDGRIVIAGAFTSINDTARNRIARFSADGVLDTTFDPSANGRVNALVVQSDGLLVIGGAFTALSPNATTSPTTRNYIARIAADGTVDANYNPSVGGVVNALALGTGGKIIAGGAFTTAQPNSDSAVTTRNYVARFNTDGTLDTAFDPNANGVVRAIAAQSDGSVVIGGEFTTLTPNVNGTATSAVARDRVARLKTDGSVDTGFTSGANGVVSTISAGADGSVVIGGAFTAVNGASGLVGRNHLARLKTNGIADDAFNPDVSGNVDTVVARSDGAVLIGGNFTGLQPNGVILVGGSFNTIGGIAQKNVALLSLAGAVNTAFQPNPNGAVNALVVQPDGKFILGGSFTTVAGASRNGIARFNADGSLDTTFVTASDVAPYALALQPDGKILAGGVFNGASIPENPSGRLVRLNTDGTVDTAFTPSAAGAVRALALQPDGRILVLADGSGVRSIVSRLNANGSADATFTAVNGSSNAINALVLQTDGRVILGGAFTAIGSSSISRLARLNASGSVDASFNPAPNGAVSALALQTDGRLVIGGSFTTVGGLPRVAIARLAATGAAKQTLGVGTDRKTITWLREGTAGEIAAVTIEVSTDAATWTQLGQATRITGTSNWQLSSSALPQSGTFYLRARGIAPAGSSSSLYEAIREVNFTSPVGLGSNSVVATGTAIDSATTVTEWRIDPMSGVLVGVTAVSASPGGIIPDVSVGGETLTSRLADLATRGQVSASSPLISGFAVSGNTSRTVLIRAVGPGLTPFGVTGVLATPQLRVYDAGGHVIASNNGWANDATVSAAAAQTGAFPLAAGSADAALVSTLAPGSYSVHVIDGSGSSAGGVALLEIYDAGSTADANGARLVNLSSRGTVSPGGTLIGGLVISGNAPRTLLVRGVGPALANFGVSGVLANPSLTVYDGQNRVVATSDDWSRTSAEGLITADTASLNTTFTLVGAFGFDLGSKDAAVVVTLPAGAYTVQVSGADSTAGAAMIEIYEVR